MDGRARMVRVRLGIALLLVLGVVGCARGTTVSSVSVPPATGVETPVDSATGTEVSGRLVSRRVDTPPIVDGQVEGAWAAAALLRVPLTWGMGGTEHALDVDLRSLYTGEAVYFLAHWPGEPPAGEDNTVSNKLTVHWRIPDPAAQHLDCAVVCHTAFADGNGRFAYANAETIPQGGNEALAAAGGWEAGTWTLEWGRSLLSDNPYDLQLSDRDQAYTFLVKIFEGVENRPDPVSERHLFVFQP